MHIDKIYGKHEIKNSLTLRILKTPKVQRLKKVNQYGALKYVTQKMTTSRFEHGLGVYVLLNKFWANREEQTAGPIHDIKNNIQETII